MLKATEEKRQMIAKKKQLMQMLQNHLVQEQRTPSTPTDRVHGSAKTRPTPTCETKIINFTDADDRTPFFNFTDAEDTTFTLHFTDADETSFVVRFSDGTEVSSGVAHGN